MRTVPQGFPAAPRQDPACHACGADAWLHGSWSCAGASSAASAGVSHKPQDGAAGAGRAAPGIRAGDALAFALAAAAAYVFGSWCPVAVHAALAYGCGVSQ